jgi:MFS-type transporter involved in bile tolerance (Atg22 family)
MDHLESPVKYSPLGWVFLEVATKRSCSIARIWADLQMDIFLSHKFVYCRVVNAMITMANALGMHYFNSLKQKSSF